MHEIEFMFQEFNNIILKNNPKTVLVWDVYGSDLNLTETKRLLLNSHNVKVFSFKESQLEESVVAKEDVSEETLWFYQQIEEENSRQLNESFEEIDFEEAHKEYLLSLEKSKKQTSAKPLEELELLNDFDDFFDEIDIE